jgi:hypothetical protein
LKQNGNTGIKWDDYKIDTNEISFNGIKQNILKRKATHN